MYLKLTNKQFEKFAKSRGAISYYIIENPKHASVHSFVSCEQSDVIHVLSTFFSI